jgi:LPS O-antigen subunit length determinant protein (WzzB/FepE family)
MRKSEEIEIINIVAALWKNKYKILIITAVTSLLFFTYQNQKKDLYKISLNIEKNYFGINNLRKINQQILVLSMSNRLLEENNLKINLPNSSEIFDSIILDFLNYNELFVVLKKYESVQKEIEGLSRNKASSKLLSLAKQFKISPSKTSLDQESVRLTIHWHNAEEALAIFEETINIAMINVKKNFIRNIQGTLDTQKALLSRKINNLKLDYKNAQELISKKNQARILFLEYHLDMAKKLNITSYDSKNLINTTSETYYLLGTEAINFEILALKKLGTEKSNSFFGEYNENLLKLNADIKMLERYLKYTIETEYENLIDIQDIKRSINYNIKFAEITNLKKTPMHLLLFGVIIGLILAISYIAFSSVLRRLNKLNVF